MKMHRTTRLTALTVAPILTSKQAVFLQQLGYCQHYTQDKTTMNYSLLGFQCWKQQRPVAHVMFVES